MIHKLPLEKLNILSELIQDYLANDDFFTDLITAFPSRQSVLERADHRSFDVDKRAILMKSIEAQYSKAGLAVPDALSKLKNENAFTVTTGHQLNLFTGPLYSIFKICSVIKLCRDLNDGSDKEFLPVFWMATEDHDLDEINHTYCYGKKVEWQTEQTGAVGRMTTEGVQSAIDHLGEILGERGRAFIDLLTWAYEAENLSIAHRRLVYRLFEGTDLIILDADNHDLKAMFRQTMKDEILQGNTRVQVERTNKLLENTYKVQAHARDINLFYLSEGRRSRIVRDGEGFTTRDDLNQWTREELMGLLENEPENFSPNVLMRPLYQETILPNLAYIGGGGELAYWIQLKQNFDYYKTPFPILILRSSMAFMTSKDISKLGELGLELIDLFKSEDELPKLVVSEKAEDIELDGELDDIKMVYKTILDKVTAVDQSLEGTVNADVRKIEKSIEQLKGKVIKAQKRQHDTAINQALKLKSKLFPDGHFQERYANVSQYYDVGLVETVLGLSNPITSDFIIVER